MFLNNLKILTWYTHGVIHLDGGQNYVKEKRMSLIYSDFRFKTIFWFRFIYRIEQSVMMRIYSVLLFAYTLVFSVLVSFIKLEWCVLGVKVSAIRDAIRYIQSEKYNGVIL